MTPPREQSPSRAADRLSWANPEHVAGFLMEFLINTDRQMVIRLITGSTEMDAATVVDNNASVKKKKMDDTK